MTANLCQTFVVYLLSYLVTLIYQVLDSLDFDSVFGSFIVAYLKKYMDKDHL